MTKRKLKTAIEAAGAIIFLVCIFVLLGTIGSIERIEIAAADASVRLTLSIAGMCVGALMVRIGEP